jgi:hypothetical protein
MTPRTRYAHSGELSIAPSGVGDPAFEDLWAALQRGGASPGMARQLFEVFARQSPERCW